MIVIPFRSLNLNFRLNSNLDIYLSKIIPADRKVIDFWVFFKGHKVLKKNIH